MWRPPRTEDSPQATTLKLLFVVGAAVGTTAAFAMLTAPVDVGRRRLTPDARHRRVGVVAATRLYVAYGQSKSECCGDLGGAAYDPRVVQHFGNATYAMSEPMLGATCRGGCVWPDLGARLVAEANGTDAVAFATCGVGGYSLAQLSEGTEPFGYLMQTLADMRRVYGRGVDGVLYHQGESDNLKFATDASAIEEAKAAYGARLEALADAVHSAGGGTMLYVSRASRCAGNGPDPHVREVQLRVGTTHPHAREGPDTDDLVGANRSADACHFSRLGFAEVARRWHAALG